MEAVKIVSQLGDKSDSFSFFGGFSNVTIRRGKWETAEDKGLCMKIDGILCPPDKVFFNKGQQPANGSPCKQVLLERANDFLSIGTDADVYILGTNGKTIEAIY